MTYLITQTFILLLIAALLGMLLGWYLTRISAAAARSSLQARLASTDRDLHALRAELDAAYAAKGGLEGERQALTREIVDLKAELADSIRQEGNDAGAVAELQAQLDECREALAAAAIPVAADHEVAVAAESVAADDAAEPALAAPAPLPDGVAADDLQQIRGIGPKIAGILQELGVRRFEQIAEWTPEKVAWINDHLKFKGRIEREEWIAQAQALLARRENGE